MNNVTHTPGPWTFHKGGAAGYGYIRDSQMRAVAPLGSMEIDNRRERAANAQLMATAPELFTALRKCAAKLERCIINSGTHPEFAAEAVAEFRAVIAKAEGVTE